MFKKPFKLKSQIQLKSSEKKKFGNDLKSLFPALTDENISSTITNKENINKMKVITWKEEDVEIYCLNKIPIYFDVVDSNIKLPTVFMVWKFPHMLPLFTTNNLVLSKLKNGADLFYPGIYPEGLLFCDTDFKRNDPVGVNLIDNKATMAIGLSLVNKNDVTDNNQGSDIGKLIKIYHTVGDHLFKIQTEAVIEQMGPPDWTLSQCEESSVNEVISEVKPKNTDNGIKDEVLNSENIVPENDNDTACTETAKESLDDLLEYCFLKALKTIPKTAFPILPATFYANHVLASLPEGKSLNIKKTKWKKFSTFLQEKSLEGLINLQSMPKNEFTIIGINTNNKKFKEFVDPYNNVTVVVEPKSGSNTPVVQQVYSVTAATLPFFSKFGLKKHDELTRNDVRNHLNDFIKSENLVCPDKPELVVLNPVLYEILKGEEITSRVNVLSGLLEKMSVQHKISKSGDGDAICHKGKMPLIEFELGLRTGNKKVTLISNLESYGINVVNFSKELQHKAAASTTIIPSVAGKKGPQLQVQGNQIAVAVKILKEKHNMNEKFMKGLEKIVKSKSKK